VLDVWFAKKKFLGHAVKGAKMLLFSSPFFAARRFFENHAYIHEKGGELWVWGVSLGLNKEHLLVFKFF
jgi:hypothetical protein